ncbi:MAG: glycoside hydrolase family 31 protein [Eubacteriales bacterium]|nr:glycoside hydrolase family 31 protein [Eubacteriales bacterium]
MIFKFQFGKPFPTEAVVAKDQIQDAPGQPVPFVDVKEGESITYQMQPDDLVYGLGQNVRGINKRGWIYSSNCSDNPNHQEDTRSLYAAHNFLMIDGAKKFAMFLDYPGIVTFDIGYTRSDELKITLSDWNLDLYIWEGESMTELVKAFRHMIGRSYIAPKWAFGYGQSRWGYQTAEDVRRVVQKHKENDLPLDSVYMDIDYMERYKDFTINEERFPNFEAFNEEMKAQQIHLVPIIDAGVKKEEGYPVYEEGVEKGYFCKKEDGSNFVAAVWPGHSMFTDFLNPEARKWFGDHYAFLLDKGVEGFWNDMNEPSIFYTEDRIRDVIDEISKLKGKNLDLTELWKMLGLVNGMANNVEDYKTFFHETEVGRLSHEKVHNLFGYNMTRAAGEAFERLCPEKRILMFSRSSYIGMHRYGGIWQGDNKSWWSHLLMNIKMCPSLNMCGILYTGADLGGFGSNATEDLLLRWLQFGVFTPLMRNHSAIGTREQEIYQFQDIGAFRNILKFRYRLLPYLYSEYMKAVLKEELYFSPLAFMYPEDAFASQVEDQLFVGESLMVAPVYEQNARGRYVYLPEEMRMFRLKRDGSLESEVLDAGHHYVKAELEEMVFFLRKGHALVLAEAANRVADVDFGHLQALTFGDEAVEYEYYHDDGYTKDYENPKNWSRLEISGDGEISC